MANHSNHINGVNGVQDDPPRRIDHFENLHGYRLKRCLIGIEEHCSVPEDFPDKPSTAHYLKMLGAAPSFMKGVGARLTDVDLRIRTMDKCGMAAMILSLNEPGCQGFTVDQLDQSIRFARNCNDYLHETYCAQYPERFFALATVPTQDGQAAADEVERVVKKYGFRGVMINGFTPGKTADENIYLDDPMYEPFWAKVQELDVPVFVHPKNPADSTFPKGRQYPGMRSAAWGYTRETAEHAFWIMLSGVFDRYPKAKVILGHLGEGLSFVLPRSDHRLRTLTDTAHGTHKRPLYHYFQRNFLILTSGHFTTSALTQLLSETKSDMVMYSDDFPFESCEEHTEWFRTIPVCEQTWKDMAYRNAIKHFKLPLNFDDDE